MANDFEGDWKEFNPPDALRWGKKEVTKRDGISIQTEHVLNPGEPKDIGFSIEEAKKAHRAFFEDNRVKNGFPPTAIMVGPDGLWTLVVVPKWKEMREQGRKELHYFATKSNAAAIVWGSDSFYLERDPEAIKAGKWENMETPSEAPDRREAFVITTIWPDGSANMDMYPYRVEGDKIVWEETITEQADPDQKIEQRICKAWGGMVQ